MKPLRKLYSHTSWSSSSTKKNFEPVKTELAVQTGHQGPRQDSVSLWTCIRQHGKAVVWSVLLSTVVIMESFDVVVTTGFFALNDFQHTFGELNEVGQYEVTPSVQSGIVNAVLAGEIVGLIICGWIAERIGFKRTLCGALVLVSLFLFLLFCAKHQAAFILGQFFCGIPLGVFQTLPVTYASEILPAPLQPYLTTYVNFCWAFGGLLGSTVQRGAYSMSGSWSWRLPIALQWIWPLPLIVGVLLAPESPWWLARHGLNDRAFQSLTRLTPDPDDTLQTINSTNAREMQMTQGTKYPDCFRHGNLRRTEATAVVWCIQMACGSTLIYFSTPFFVEVGLSSKQSFTFTPVMYSLGCAGTIASWFLIARMGRKSLYLYGTLLLAIAMFGIGIAGLFRGHVEARWTAAVLLIVFTLIYDCSVGPVCYSLVTELPSSRLRQKTVALARCAYLVMSIIMNILVPRMLGDEPNQWNWGPKSGFFFGGGCVLSVIWIWYRLPETKNKTVEEVDEIFECLRVRHAS